MPRRKRQHPLLLVVRNYLNQHLPELRDAPLQLQLLDGPPSSPRYAVTAEVCTVARCPLGIPPATALAGRCAVSACPLRQSARLLLDRRGGIIQVIRSGIHWG